MKYWNPETKQLQDSPYIKVKQNVEVEQKAETKKRIKKKEV